MYVAVENVLVLRNASSDFSKTFKFIIHITKPSNKTG